MEKVKSFVDNPSFIILCLQYLKSNRLQNMQKRRVLIKNCDIYYRAFENLINNSKFKNCILANHKS